MFCNQPTTQFARCGEDEKPANTFQVSSKHMIYSFCNNSIPVAAVFTKNYKRFREIIFEHYVDINAQLASLIRKINAEQTILTTTKSADIPERSKSAIHKYIMKLEREVEILIQVSNDLQILKNNDSILKKLFKKIHPNDTPK